MTFVKDVVRSLHIGPDRVRVAVVPYNTDVFQAFGLLQYSTQEDIINAIGQCVCCGGGWEVCVYVLDVCVWFVRVVCVCAYVYMCVRGVCVYECVNVCVCVCVCM